MSNNLYWNLAVIGNENIFRYLQKQNEKQRWELQILNCSSVGEFVRIRHTYGYSQNWGQNLVLAQQLQRNEDQVAIIRHLEYVKRLGFSTEKEGLILDLAENDFLDSENGLVKHFQFGIPKNEQVFEFVSEFVNRHKKEREYFS